MSNANISIHHAHPDEAEDASNLVLRSAPFLADILGGETKTKKILAHLFSRGTNLFSFEHTYFAKKEGTIAGMALGYE
ncbi:MAG: GNAT family N-acetyltransferase, partial [Atribacterota bacterium]|nr:GNAT family N-acetyltransferase [Atribacterota bacterium]